MPKFCPLFSGSKGNSTYVATTEGAILIDAGVSAKKLCCALQEVGVSPDFIKGIFITHSHSDHIGGLRVFAKKYKIPVYATSKTVAALKKCDGFECITLNEIKDNIELAGMSISYFSTPHDCPGSCGYIISADSRKIAVCTDVGKVTDDIHNALCGCDLVMLESNHDVLMLESCAFYSYDLKRRILSDNGHLSNNACAGEVVRLVESGTTRFVLSHLSENTNLPELALETVRTNMSLSGYVEDVDYSLCVASPSNNRVIII